MTVFDDFKKFVSDEQNAQPFKTWAKQNPGELQKWSAFRDAILAGQRPSPPTLATFQGKALVDAGMEYLDSLSPIPPPPTPTPVCVTRPKLTGSNRIGSILTVTPGVWQ